MKNWNFIFRCLIKFKHEIYKNVYTLQLNVKYALSHRSLCFFRFIIENVFDEIVLFSVLTEDLFDLLILKYISYMFYDFMQAFYSNLFFLLEYVLL